MSFGNSKGIDATWRAHSIIGRTLALPWKSLSGGALSLAGNMTMAGRESSSTVMGSWLRVTSYRPILSEVTLSCPKRSTVLRQYGQKSLVTCAAAE